MTSQSPTSANWLQQVFDGLYERFERDGVFDEAAAKQAILSHIQQVEVETRIALLAKIANTESWEESAWVYCTEPEIGLSPNEFEAVRHNYPSLNELPQPEEDKYLTTPKQPKEASE